MTSQAGQGVIWPSYHQSSILSLDCNTEGVLVSGAESCDVCIWDAKNRSLVHQLSGFPDEVTAVSFYVAEPHYFWVSSDCMLLKFDLRNYEQPVYETCYSDDDVNMILMNEKDQLLATCDDSGAVTVIDDSKPTKNVIHTFSDHDSCVSSIQFHPSAPELFSAGTDAQLRSWNLVDGSSSSTLYLNACFHDDSQAGSESAAEGSSAELFSGNILTPPMAHSISLNSSANVLACGVENSALLLFDVLKISDGTSSSTAASSKSKLRLSSLLTGHTAAVSQVTFANNWTEAGVYGGDLLVSGGSDKRIISWRAEINEEFEDALEDISEQGAGDGLDLEQPMEDAESETTELNSPVITSSALNKICFQQATCKTHHNKINWLCPSVVDGEPQLFVADLSTVVTSYSHHALFS